MLHGDCLELLPTLKDLDACICDPPYHLTSIVKRFSNATEDDVYRNAELRKTFNQGASPFARQAKGFMGKQWDGGDIAFNVETWRLVYDALKPGAHLVAFGGTRTFHRMACAIEDAGFEIRDCLCWLYGTGFPKSHDISKAIDKHGGQQIAWFGPWFRKWREERGITQKQVAALFPSKSGNLTGCVANWELGFNLPTPEQFNAIRDAYGLPFATLEAAEREVLETRRDSGGRNVPILNADGARNYNITAPTTPEALKWQGWGTALKPAFEPIILARKPLSEGTVAANVLAHGTGAINIDACRIEADDAPEGRTRHGGGRAFAEGVCGFKQDAITTAPAGRWPANVCHDGSDEVEQAFAAFGEKGGGFGVRGSDAGNTMYGNGLGLNRPTTGQTVGFGDTGTASRFFYSAKASKADRAGSKHPTVKPQSLMRWLCRLVTPPGGTILDCFAGSGSTGAAAMREGFNSILIEREAEYVADIQRRIAQVEAEATTIITTAQMDMFA
ncbi:MAG TPA: DNA methyltransferase [Candidatus Angelobacter sp.]|nr:DNA methyltransferase [Candidatus Angelobacter sp.]